MLAGAYVYRATSLIVVQLGVLISVGWLTGIPALVRLIPVFPVTSAASALMLIAAGLASFCLDCNFRKTATLLSLLTAASALVELGFGIVGYPGLSAGDGVNLHARLGTSLAFFLFASGLAAHSLRIGAGLPLLLGATATALAAGGALLLWAFSFDPSGPFALFDLSPVVAGLLLIMAIEALIFSSRADDGRHVVALIFLLFCSHVLMAGLTVTTLPNLLASSGDPHDLPALVTSSTLAVGALFVFLVWFAVDARKTAHALKASENRYRAILDTTADGLVTIDHRGTMLTLNPACERIFGYAADECVGRNIKMLMPDPYRDAHDGYLANYRETGQKRIIGIGRQVEGRRKDGTIFPIDLAVGEVRTGAELIFSGIIRDISERVEQQRELEYANRELEEFAYRTSHDLRSPIASTGGLLQLASDALEKGDHATTRDALRRCLRNVTRLEGLIDDIHTLTHIRKAREEVRPINVAECVRELLAAMSSLENFERISIHVAMPGTQIVLTKPTRLAAIVGNLVSNAIKYADLDKSEPYVAITGAWVGGRYILDIEDNGIGIPEDKRHLLFEMFERFHPKRSQGSGLGLYILKSTVKLLGGTVSYTPLESGSKFTVEFPAEAA